MLSPLSRGHNAQVDERDIARLIVFASKMGFVSRRGNLAEDIHSLSESELNKAQAMSDDVVEKPILCTKQFE